MTATARTKCMKLGRAAFERVASVVGEALAAQQAQYIDEGPVAAMLKHKGGLVF